MKIFDFHIMNSPHLQSQPAHQNKEIRLISLKDDEFILTRADYEDIFEEEQGKKSGWVQKNIQYFEYIYAPLRAFSINWPYVVFTGIGNFIIIVNAFDRKQMRRIQVAEETDDITICQTYITDTYDLFVVINADSKYSLYLIDLDAANVMEFKGDNYDYST